MHKERIHASHPVVEVHPLKRLLSYQTGAVVSRALLKKKTGTVTLFAFDEGEGLSEHTAPFDAMVYMLDGAADVTVESETHRVADGDMLILPANRPHALKAVSRFMMLLIMIRSEE